MRKLGMTRTTHSVDKDRLKYSVLLDTRKGREDVSSSPAATLRSREAGPRLTRTFRNGRSPLHAATACLQASGLARRPFLLAGRSACTREWDSGTARASLKVAHSPHP